MTVQVPRLPFSLDPLIAEARRRARQRRFLLAVVAAVVALAVSGAVFATHSAGSLVAGPPAAGCPANVGAPSYLASARTRTAAARRDEVRLLCFVVLPRGVQLLTTAPALLKGEGILGVFPKPFAPFAMHRVWLVRAPMAAVVSFEETHAPAGSLPSGCGTPRSTVDCGVGVLSGPHVPPNAALGVRFPAIRGRVGSRALRMSFLGLPDGWTAIRVDAVNRPWTPG